MYAPPTVGRSQLSFVGKKGVQVFSKLAKRIFPSGNLIDSFFVNTVLVARCLLE
jgi:hypothetical protein